jgi:hypothetical protein
VTQVTNELISRIYHSREDRIKDIHAEAERLNYDGHDVERLNGAADVIEEYLDNLTSHLDLYIETIENKDEDSEINYARRKVIESWALAQAAVSKLGWMMRFDGNVAYERMINALKTGAACDMRGL